jgi:hypothetical protein
MNTPQPSHDSWTMSDLDRCEHGRHSIDPCLSCPGGWSTGNKHLTDGQRIGTNLYGEPILATPVRPRRGT